MRGVYDLLREREGREGKGRVGEVREEEGDHSTKQRARRAGKFNKSDGKAYLRETWLSPPNTDAMRVNEELDDWKPVVVLLDDEKLNEKVGRRERRRRRELEDGQDKCR